jgi:hypothetical protein
MIDGLRPAGSSPKDRPPGTCGSTRSFPRLAGQSRKTRPVKCPVNGAKRHGDTMMGVKIGYARVSTDGQDLSGSWPRLPSSASAPTGSMSTRV